MKKIIAIIFLLGGILNAQPNYLNRSAGFGVHNAANNGYNILGSDSLVYPIGIMKPGVTHKKMAMYICPTGTVTQNAAQGLAWFGVADKDLVDSANFVSARVGIGSTNSYIGSFKKGTATVKPLVFVVGDEQTDIKMTIKTSGVINIAGVPTSSAGLVTGDIWSSSGTLKVIE